MFVSVVVESGSLESAESINSILNESGFNKIQKSCWECINIDEKRLSILKKNIDNVTDYYDKVRMYQFPVNGSFVITELKQKKWRRAVFNSKKS